MHPTHPTGISIRERRRLSGAAGYYPNGSGFDPSVGEFFGY
jgi:hypothetical protein